MISTPHFLFKAAAQLNIARQFVTRKLISMEKLRFRLQSNNVKEIGPFAPIKINHSFPEHNNQVSHIGYIVAITTLSILTGGFLCHRAWRYYHHTFNTRHDQQSHDEDADSVISSLKGSDPFRGSTSVHGLESHPRLSRWWPWQDRNNHSASGCVRSPHIFKPPGREGLPLSARQSIEQMQEIN